MRTLRHRRPSSPHRRRQAGAALVFALFGLGALMIAGASALLSGSGNLVATRNYRGATQVHFVAESGISRALQAVNAVGVVNFQNEVVDNWASFGGVGSKTFTPLAGFRYQMTAVADAADPANRGIFRSMGTGPEGVRNTVVAALLRSNVPSTAPGAIYLATDLQTNADFQGDMFLVDGNDHLITGGAGPGAPVPGIATRNDANTSETVSSLSDPQKNNILGQGFSASPLAPSVLTSPASPTVAQLQEIIDTLLAKPGVVPFAGNHINGNATFGTNASPQITYMSANSGVTIKGNGNVSGAGILIVEGNLTIQGTLNFNGLVLVAGATSVEPDSETGVTGNATLYGSLWTADLNLNVGGSAIVAYSSQALQFANSVAGGGALPSPMVVTSLVDCAQVPVGSAGCP